MPALQGFMLECPLATPTIGLSKSPSLKSTARNIARLGERAMPAVISLLRQLSAMFFLLDYGGRGALYSGRSPPKGAEFGCAGARRLIYYLRVFDTFAESDGTSPPALLRHPRRGTAFRPRRGEAAHIATAAVDADPCAGKRTRRNAAEPHAAPCFADPGRHRAARGSASYSGTSRTGGADDEAGGPRRDRRARDRLHQRRGLQRASGRVAGISPPLSAGQPDIAGIDHGRADPRPGCRPHRRGLRSAADQRSVARVDLHTARTADCGTAGKASAGAQTRQTRTRKTEGRAIHPVSAAVCPGLVRRYRQLLQGGGLQPAGGTGSDPDADHRQPGVGGTRRGVDPSVAHQSATYRRDL